MRAGNSEGERLLREEILGEKEILGEQGLNQPAHIL